MKTKLLLLSIAAVVTVSADCQAMMRRAPVRVAMPRVQRAPQRVFSFAKKENKLAMPVVAGNRLNAELVNLFKKHTELSVKREKLVSQFKNSKQSLVSTALITAPLATLVYGMVLPYGNGLGLLALPLPATLLLADSVLGLKADYVEKKSVEQELANVVTEQKRQLRIPDDIQ